MPGQETTDDQCHPVINVGEEIGKWVGRRGTPIPSGIQKTGRQIYQSRGFAVCPKGVHRFNSHEEADEWMIKMAVDRAIKAEKENQES